MKIINKIIQIEVASSIFGTSELYGLDNDGNLYEFDFDKEIWKTLKVNNFGQEGYENNR